MIDHVSINKIIPISPRSFRKNIWDKRTTEDGGAYYWCKRNGVTIRYYFQSQRLIIDGKLITLLHNTQVQNFDDIYGNLKDEFLDEINGQINSLFTQPLVDIRDFLTTRIDYCINVETPYVDEYIAFLKRAFQKVDSGGKIDHTQEFDLDGSVYIKNAAEYKANVRKNYTLNVYNKKDRLEFQERNKIAVEEADFVLAENILRVEVQASYELIRSLRKKFGVDRTFGELFDYQIAFYAVKNVFKRVFLLKPECDFYTYQEAKKRMPRGAAGDALRSLATNHNIKGEKYDYARKIIQKKGVYPYCLLPAKSPVSCLRNPVKLVQDKIRPYI